MRCKYAFFKYPLWLLSLRGMLQKKWERLLIRSRMFHPLSSARNTDTTRSLVFPRWDVVVVILSVFLMTYTYIEAKSNYHRGSILILRYVLVRNPFLLLMVSGGKLPCPRVRILLCAAPRRRPRRYAALGSPSYICYHQRLGFSSCSMTCSHMALVRISFSTSLTIQKYLAGIASISVIQFTYSDTASCQCMLCSLSNTLWMRWTEIVNLSGSLCPSII